MLVPRDVQRVDNAFTEGCRPWNVHSMIIVAADVSSNSLEDQTGCHSWLMRFGNSLARWIVEHEWEDGKGLTKTVRMGCAQR